MTAQKDNLAARHPSHSWTRTEDYDNGLPPDHTTGSHCTECPAAYCLFCPPSANDEFKTGWREPCPKTGRDTESGGEAESASRSSTADPVGESAPPVPHRISTRDNGGEQ